MEKELQIISVNKHYKMENKHTFQALYDINVEFEKGELVSIVGESGSGKSTLMNLIGGLDSDYSGTIIAGGENLSKLTDKQLDNYRKNKVGFVFQSFNLISHLSILDNVTLALTLSNVPEKEKVRRATEILNRVGLSDQLKKKPTQLSGGQKQRVAIARALINDPEIIIADEPTGALDSTTSMQILQILKEIADGGKLVIMVTHSEKVASVSSRVVEISDGRITGDHINEKYVKTAKKKSKKEKIEVAPAEKEAKNTGKNKQNLSMWQAIRLSVHNMWASKTKNFLMSFGVAIGIGSLILMLCFSSGITDFISDTMNSYSNPNIATISKKLDRDNSEGLTDNLGYLPFETTEDTDDVQDLFDEINAGMEASGNDFRVHKGDENVSFGFQLLTPAGMATVSYYGDKDDPTTPTATSNIIYVYTIPPYYSDKNIIDGEMSHAPEVVRNQDGQVTQITKKGGIMFTPAVAKLFNSKKSTEDESANTSEEEIDPIGKEVKITFKTEDKTEIDFEDTICGIMDSSIMSNLLVVYVDYSYLEAVFSFRGQSQYFKPNYVYIDTGSEETTNKINEILAKSEKYTGSIEERLAAMFENMSSVIGTSLVVISSISLIVSAMMILVVLYMSVTERTKEIGVLKSIGARRKDIKRIFTSESFLVGLLSGVLGIVFNLILTLVVWLILKTFIGFAPIGYRWWYFFLAVAVSVIISMLSGLYPASKAAKLDPVESLRRE